MWKHLVPQIYNSKVPRFLQVLMLGFLHKFIFLIFDWQRFSGEGILPIARLITIENLTEIFFLSCLNRLFRFKTLLSKMSLSSQVTNSKARGEMIKCLQTLSFDNLLHPISCWSFIGWFFFPSPFFCDCSFISFAHLIACGLKVFFFLVE